MTGQRLAHARALVELSRWDDALAALDQVQVADDQRVEVLCLQAQCLLALSRWAQALAAAESARASAPHDEWPHRLVAVAAANLGRYRHSVQAARAAARLDPSSVLTLHTLALTELKAGNKVAADSAAAGAIAVDADDPLAHETVARVALGTGRLAMAEAAARRALTLSPQSADVQALLAAVLENLNQQDEARELRINAVRTQPQDREHRRDLLRMAVPLIAGGLLVKIIALQVTVRVFRLMWEGSHGITVVVLHLVIALLWVGWMIRRRIAGRQLPTGYYAGLRPERRQSDLRWLRTCGWLLIVLGILQLTFSPGRGLGLPAAEIALGAAEVAGAALLFRRLASRFDVRSSLKPPRVLARSITEAILSRVTAARLHGDPLEGLVREGQPSLNDRARLIATSIFWPLVAAVVTLLIEPVAAPFVALAVAALTAALRDMRPRRLGETGGYLLVMDERLGTVPGRGRIAARGALRLLLMPVLAVDFLLNRHQSSRCLHDRLTSTTVVTMHSALDDVASVGSTEG